MTPEEVYSYIEQWAKAKNSGRIEVNFINGEISNIYVVYSTKVEKPSPEAQGKKIDNG